MKPARAGSTRTGFACRGNRRVGAGAPYTAIILLDLPYWSLAPSIMAVAIRGREGIHETTHVGTGVCRARDAGERSGAACLDRRHDPRQIRIRYPGCRPGGAEPVARRRRDDRFERARRLPVSGAAAGPLRNHRQAAGISVGQIIEHPAGAGPDPEDRSGDGGRRRHRESR